MNPPPVDTSESSSVGELSSVGGQGDSRQSASTSSTLSPIEQIRANSAANDGVKPVVRHRSKALKAVLHLTRRGHLYAGLLLIPWVFLYGVTGFLFNHPNVWPDQEMIEITKRHTQGTDLAKLPKAQEIAAEVVASLNAKNKAQYELINPGAINFGRGGFSITVLGEGKKQYSVALNSNGTGTMRALPAGQGGQGATPAGPGAAGGRGRAAGGAGPGGGGPGSPGGAEGAVEGGRRRGGAEGGRGEGGPEGGGRQRGAGGSVQPSQPAAPFAVASGLMLSKSPLDAVAFAMPEVLRNLKMDSATVNEIRLNPLTFTIEGEGKRWSVTYNVLTGSVTGTEAPDAREGTAMSFRRFLLRLHMAHGYPADESNMRWVWAIMVDAMSFIMVFWGISGIVMWWQIKRTRLLGGICLGVSLMAATYIGIGMHELITVAGR
ncbi:PepSY domain-containing protein [Planctomicrobium sp. SH527]|uniref:PepSY domain-containing protein n=1 Tax=Planctomicrobium sp. SH527 TaxID=3448123 RepID=UPI003F5C4C4E